MSDSTTGMSGTDYERLTRDVYEALLRSDGIDTVEVCHDTEVLGRSGCSHQIDVYWEFRLGGVLFRTAIECKRYASSLEIGRVRDFYAALADIGNIQGIIVTTTGYQSGAKKFADFYGINLLELRTPAETDWAGKFKDVAIGMNVCTPKIVSSDVTLDHAWHKAHLDRIQKNHQLQLSGMDNEVGLLDANGQLARSWYDIEMGLPIFIHNPATDDPSREVRIHDIDAKGLFIRDPTFGLIPISSFRVNYKVLVDNIQINILGAEIVKFILRDLKSGRIHQFRAHGGVIDIIPPPPSI
jgi:hypothetical protein